MNRIQSGRAAAIDTRPDTGVASSKWIGAFVFIACLTGASVAKPETAAAADLEMVDALGNVTGVIDVRRDGLQVYETTGTQLFYRRAPRYDLPGGRYLGFYNPTLNRIIRFPRSGHGFVERADLDEPIPRFVPASVSVRPIGSGNGFAPYLDVWLGHQQPLPGYGFPGLGFPQLGFPGLGLPGDALGSRQLGLPGGFGMSGTLEFGTSLSIGPSPVFTTPSPLPPSSVLLSSRTVENPPLSPVELELINTQGETLVVTLADARQPQKQVQYSIEPGKSQRVKLPRDSGATRVSVYQTFDAFGNAIEQQVAVDVPPEPRYEVIVHRWRIQSIAIDRTGKSPNVIEDINRQGLGVGRFWLPAGEALSSGRMDVFEQATSARNPGAVAPLVSD